MVDNVSGLFVVFDPIPVHRVPHEWNRLLSLLSPKIIKCEAVDARSLLRDLMSGDAEAAYVRSSKMNGVFVSQITGTRCTINCAGGKVDANPKEWLKLVRWAMTRCEELARASNCTEMVISGRDWSRIFPDFQPFSDFPNGLKKVLS
jgi:hypothetical protein